MIYYRPLDGVIFDRMKPRARLAYALLGHLMVGFGVLGMVLPIWPTTVFLLAAAWFYSRSGGGLREWLLRHRWFGPYLRAYLERRGLTLRAKVWTLAFLWLTLGVSQAFLPAGHWGRALLGAIGIAVSIHIACLKLFRKDLKSGDLSLN